MVSIPLRKILSQDALKSSDPEAAFLEKLVEFQYGLDVVDDLSVLSRRVGWAKGWPQNPKAFWNVEAFLWKSKIPENIRLFISSKLSSLSKGQNLDLGCGAYSYVASVGFDLSEKMLSFNDNCMRKIVGDVEKRLPFAKGEFDSVTAIFVLNYIHNLKQLLEQVRRVVRVGGLFVVVLSSTSVAQWQRQKEVSTKTKEEWVDLFEEFFTNVKTETAKGLWFFVCEV